MLLPRTNVAVIVAVKELRRVLIWTVTFACCVLALACSKDTTSPQVKVRIGVQHISPHQHIFAGQEYGLFAKHGLTAEVVRFASANLLMDALLARRIDVGLINLQVAGTVAAKDPGKFQIVNVLVWGETTFPDYVIVPKSSSIKTLSDLKGKTLGLHPGSAVRAFSKTLLTMQGLDPKDITTSQVEPGNMAAALASGSVDALYCMDPVATQLMSSGQGQVLLANPMRMIFPPPVPISGTAVSSDLLKADRDTALKMIRALDESIDSLRTKTPTDIAALVAKTTGGDATLEQKMNRVMYWKSTEIDRRRVSDLLVRFADLGIVPPDVTAADLLGAAGTAR